jgi:hypothetical protein
LGGDLALLGDGMCESVSLGEASMDRLLRMVLSPAIGACNGATTMNANKRRKAFSLVELLVLIAVIGTLTGLLWPAVRSCR